MNPIFLNLLYSTAGAFLTLAFMIIGYKLLDAMTPFNTSIQLQGKNTAVGLMVGGMFVGIGIAVGLVVGMALN